MNVRRIMSLLGIMLLVLQAAQSPCAEGDKSARRILELDDFDRFEPPDSLQISPDGERIAYVFDDRIEVVGTRTRVPRPLTSSGSNAWRPRWSADGKSLYFLSDRDGGMQLWQLPVDGFGEARKLTSFASGISSIKLAPDESRLLLELSDDDLAKPDDEKLQPFVVTRRQFKRDAGAGYITAGQSKHLYIYDLENESLTQLTSGEFEENEAAWSPDGNSIVFVSNREDPDGDYSNDLWIVATNDENPGRPLRRLTNDSQTKQAPSFSPDGRLVAYITAVDGVYGLQHLAVIPSTGGEPVVLTLSLDRWVTSFDFSDDGRWIYFNYDDSGATTLARLRVRDGKIENLVEGDRMVSAFDVGTGDDLAVLANNANDVADVYSLRGKRLTRLTDLHRDVIGPLSLGDKFHVSFESRDGTVVEAFITTPPGYERGRAYPAILRIHGGPVGQVSWGFNFMSQYLASSGYVVIEPNPRGSSGRGQAYINAIYRTWGITDYDDVIAAVDYAIAQGIADPARLAVTGYSYGGYMTNVVITRTNRFGAAASGAGHSLIEANFGHDMYQQWYIWELGPPWENRERYDALSPLLRAGSVETPTIFLGGRIDWNVPVLNAELFYQALRVRGIDTELVVYPGVHHGGWPEEFEKDYLTRVLAWFDKYLAKDQPVRYGVRKADGY